MKSIEPLKAVTFVVSLAVIAGMVHAAIHRTLVTQMPQHANLPYVASPLQPVITSPQNDASQVAARKTEQEAEARQLAAANTERARIQADDEARMRKAAEDAAEARVRFLGRYLNPSVNRSGSGRAVAVVMASQEGQVNLHSPRRSLGVSKPGAPKQ